MKSMEQINKEFDAKQHMNRMKMADLCKDISNSTGGDEKLWKTMKEHFFEHPGSAFSTLSSRIRKASKHPATPNCEGQTVIVDGVEYELRKKH